MKREETAHWKADLDALFKPASIAVVGASDSGRGARVIDNLRLVGYPGKIYPINPKHASVHGLRCYADVLAIDDAIDCVTIQVPGDCGARRRQPVRRKESQSSRDQ